MLKVPQEQKMLKGLLPRVIYHQGYEYTKILMFDFFQVLEGYRVLCPQTRPLVAIQAATLAKLQVSSPFKTNYFAEM